MRHIVVVLIAIVFWLLMFFLKQHKEKILISGIIVLSMVSGIYTFCHADSIVPKRYPINQTFYSPDYIEKGEFPDAFLRLYLKGRKVYVKNDLVTPEKAEENGDNWLYVYYHAYNMDNYLESVNVQLIEDESLNDIIIDSQKAKDFDKLGYVNDLLRNSVMYTKHDQECGNFTYYLWYYGYFSKTAYMYLNTESADEEELVLIWQSVSKDTPEESATEDIYIMGKSYYESQIRK